MRRAPGCTYFPASHFCLSQETASFRYCAGLLVEANQLSSCDIRLAAKKTNSSKEAHVSGKNPKALSLESRAGLTSGSPRGSGLAGPSRPHCGTRDCQKVGEFRARITLMGCHSLSPAPEMFATPCSDSGVTKQASEQRGGPALPVYKRLKETTKSQRQPPLLALPFVSKALTALNNPASVVIRA